jgi:hypothetical protein
MAFYFLCKMLLGALKVMAVFNPMPKLRIMWIWAILADDAPLFLGTDRSAAAFLMLNTLLLPSLKLTRIVDVLSNRAQVQESLLFTESINAGLDGKPSKQCLEEEFEINIFLERLRSGRCIAEQNDAAVI